MQACAHLCGDLHPGSAPADLLCAGALEPWPLSSHESHRIAGAVRTPGSRTCSSQAMCVQCVNVGVDAY